MRKLVKLYGFNLPNFTITLSVFLSYNKTSFYSLMISQHLFTCYILVFNGTIGPRHAPSPPLLGSSVLHLPLVDCMVYGRYLGQVWVDP